MNSLAGNSTTSLIDEGIGNVFKRSRSFRAFSILSVAFFLLCVVAALFLVSRGYTTDSAVLIFFMGIAGVLLLMASWNRFFSSEAETPFGKPNGRLFARILLYSVLLGVVFEVLTLLSYKSGLAHIKVFSASNVIRTGIFSVLSYVAFLLISYQKPHFFRDALRRAKASISRRRAVMALLLVCASIALGVVAGVLCNRVMDLALFSSAFFWTSVFIVISAFVFFRQSAGSHPERIFLAISLSFGCFLCVCMPAETVLSWDDQIHYSRAEGLSYVCDSEYSDAVISLGLPWNTYSAVGDLPKGEYTQSAIDEYHNALNNAYSDGLQRIVSGFRAPDGESLLNIVCVGYVPSAVGIWLGRLLRLPFTNAFVLGRLFELLFYSLVCFFAIKIIPTRKVVVSVVALLPEAVFLASMYSYDYWLNGLVLLGLAMIVREMRTPDKLLASRTWLAICVCLFLAIMPKLIYFPLFGLMFLLPKSKFSSKKHRLLYYASAVFAIVVVVIAFVAPFLFSSSMNGGGGDSRGGEDVNSLGQVSFILSQPLAYASILGKFLVDSYLSVGGADSYSLSYAYMGHAASIYPFLQGSTALLLVSTALTDCDDESNALCTKGVILWTAIIFFGTVVLVATALYVLFTAVGAQTVAGCQPRYLIPVLPLITALVLNPRMRRTGSADCYAMVFLGLVAMLNAVCCWSMVAAVIMA